MTDRDPRFTVGMIAEWRGQKYRLIDIRPYRRLDGRDSAIMVWRSRCIECGDLFETTTPLQELTKATRRCPTHVRRGKIADHWRVLAAADPGDGKVKHGGDGKSKNQNRNGAALIPDGDPDPDIAPPAYRATNRVRVRGEKLSRIIWNGRQWAVTKSGIEARDGTYFIDKRRLWENEATFGWVRHMSEKDWVDQPDFAEALRIARDVHAKHSPRPSQGQARGTGRQ